MLYFIFLPSPFLFFFVIIVFCLYTESIFAFPASVIFMFSLCQSLSKLSTIWGPSISSSCDLHVHLHTCSSFAHYLPQVHLLFSLSAASFSTSPSCQSIPAFCLVFLAQFMTSVFFWTSACLLLPPWTCTPLLALIVDLVLTPPFLPVIQASESKHSVLGALNLWSCCCDFVHILIMDCAIMKGNCQKKKENKNEK